MSILKGVKALVTIVRPELTIASGVCAVTGASLALGGLPTTIDATLSFLIIFLIATFDMVENDVYDLEVDRVNNPLRPLPSGDLTIRAALAISIVCVIGSIALSSLISISVVLIAVFLLIIGHLYNWKGKDAGILGNTMVSVSVGTAFITGAVIVGRPWETLVWAFASMGFLINLSLELIGDAMDREGDLLRDSRSIAITHGREVALRASLALLLLFAIVSSLPYALGSMGVEYLAVIVPLDVLVIYMGWRVLSDVDVDIVRNRVKTIYVSLTVAMVLIVLLRLDWMGSTV